MNGTKPPLAVYGLGGVGRRIVDLLLDAGIRIPFILDRGQAGTSYRGIDVLALDTLDPDRAQGLDCLLALHNHYVDTFGIRDRLLERGFARVDTPARLPALVPEGRLDLGYWLDLRHDFASDAPRVDRLLGQLEDERSRSIVRAIQAYRCSGRLDDCPRPSLVDEYVPADLPAYHTPLRLVDCGAFTGVAVEKFRAAGYPLERLLAFEPDPANFTKLAARDFQGAEALCLPLGVWSSSTQLRFSSGQAMGSSLQPDGDTVVQCVRVDDVVHGWSPNLVKFDVEGAELDALRGMETMVRASRPDLCVSAYHTPTHLFDIPDLVASWNLGYRFHVRVHEYNTFGTVVYCRQS